MPEPKVEATCTITVYIAGDVADAIRHLRHLCDWEGLCVTVTPTTFVYTAGLETGVAVGFQAYPRFPDDTPGLRQRAVEVAESLMAALYQRSCLVVAADKTIWLTRTPPALKGGED